VQQHLAITTADVLEYEVEDVALDILRIFIYFDDVGMVHVSEDLDL
jgi:hypothetical protein